jgi:hypothetical protein
MVKKTEENVIQRIFLRNTVTVMCAVRKWLWNAGRWAPVSTKVNGETRERLGQSPKRSAAVRGQAGRGTTVAGSRRPGVAEQNVGIFSLPGFCGRSDSRAAVCRASSLMCATHLSLSLQFLCFCMFNFGYLCLVICSSRSSIVRVSTSIQTFLPYLVCSFFDLR